MTDKERAISELQRTLRDIAKTDSDILSVIPDGIFAEETEESVKSFQRKFGFTETGKVDFELWDKIQQERRKALFILSEPNQVIPIKKEDLPLVWERYYKVNDFHKRANMGTGLGLSIVKNILEMHGSRFGVESTPDQGSVFWFELSIAPHADGETEQS